MKHIYIALFLLTSIGSSYAQITSIHIESIQSGVYIGTVNPVDFPTHNFSGETIEINSNGSSEIWIGLLMPNLTQAPQNWAISRRKIGVDPSWSDWIFYGETNNAFGGIAIDELTMDSNLWVANPSSEEPIGTNEGLQLDPHINPNSNSGGCGTYRYYLGTAADPFQDSVDVKVCNTLGIDDLIEADAKVYPNPSSNQLHVEADLTDASITVIDLSGRTLLVESFNNEMSIDVAEFQDGVYFVLIEKQGMSAIKKKIIVQH